MSRARVKNIHEETQRYYEQAVTSWGALIEQGNPLYEAAFHRAFAFGDVLGHSGPKIAADLEVARIRAREWLEAQM